MVKLVAVRRTINIMSVDFTEEFGDTDDWTTSHASISIDGDGIKLTGAGDGAFPYMSKSFAASPLDFTGHSWRVDYNIHAGSGNSAYTTIATVRVYLIDSGGNQAYWKLSTDGMDPPQFYAGEWSEHCTPTGPSAAYVTDLSDIVTIRMMLELDNAANTPSVTFKKMVAWEHGTGPGYCVFCFDGAWETQKRAGDYMTTKGLKGMFAISEDLVGDSGRMSVVDLLALQSDGHMIMQYPFYDVYWGDKTPQQKIDHLTANAAWMASQGLGSATSYKIMSTPQGGMTADEADLFTSGLLTHITGTTRSNINLRPCALLYPKHLGLSSGVSSSLATFQAGMTDAYTDHGIGVAIFHQTDGQPSDMPYATFQAMVDWAADEVAAGRLIVCTPDELPIQALSE